MSVRTTADEKRDEAIDHIEKAIDLLNVVIHPQTQGSDDYDDDYYEAIDGAITALRLIYRRLK